MTDEILSLAFFLSGSLHPDHVTQQQRAFMCAAEVWAENEEWLPSAQVPPAENANTHRLLSTSISLYLQFLQQRTKRSSYALGCNN